MTREGEKEEGEKRVEEWSPDLLDRLMRCGSGPSNKAMTGFVLLRVILAVINTHIGVVYAGVLTYEAIKLTDCLVDDDGGGGSCGGGGDDVLNDQNDGHCRRLWGLLKPDSLLTVIATAAAIILAFTSIFVGTLMDITAHRKSIGFFFLFMCMVGNVFCLAIIDVSEGSIAVASGGLFITNVFLSFFFMLIESYAPEMSDDHDEVSHALSVASVWMYATQVGTIILWIIVSFIGFSDAQYGFVVSLGTLILVLVLTPWSFNRLPHTPARHTEEVHVHSESLFWYSLKRQKLMFLDVYENYYQTGIYFLANSIFDPALTALFVAAIQILVSKYKFTSDEIPIIIGTGVVSAIFGALLPKYIVNYSRSKNEKANLPTNDNDVQAPDSAVDVVHPTIYKYLIIGDLIALSTVTLLATYILQPCNLGLACIFGVFWGLTLSIAWTSGNILRSALIPGGSEAEFAGVLVTTTSITSWIPLFVFSVANELWTIEGAMITLIGFYLFGKSCICMSSASCTRCLICPSL